MITMFEKLRRLGEAVSPTGSKGKNGPERGRSLKKEIRFLY